mgnify:CR=1 FL=1
MNLTHTLRVCIYIISVLWSCVDSWYVYITRNITSVPVVPHSVLARLFPWQSIANTETQTPKRLWGKRTLLSNLRNWISRDIAANAARLMSELFQSPHAAPPLSETYWPRFRETGAKKFPSLSLSLGEEGCFAIEKRRRWQFLLFSKREAKDVWSKDKYNRTNTPPPRSLEFSLIS